jgi:TRAP-type C4-dicarboxylate transport system permease small subunit
MTMPDHVRPPGPVEHALLRTEKVIDAVARFTTYFGGFLLMGAVAIILFEVIARRFFGVSILGADELSGYVLAISMAWGYGYVLLRRGHLRVDALYVYLPLRVQRVLDLVCSFAFCGLAYLLVFRGITVFQETLELGSRAPTPLATPLWIPQIIWLMGLVFLLFCALLVTLRGFLAWTRGDFNTVEALIGASPEDPNRVELHDDPPRT